MLAIYQMIVTDERGNVRTDAHVRVRREEAGLPLATIYTDRDGLTVSSNPLDTDSEGYAAFFAPGGAYHIEAYTDDGFSRIFRYVAIGLASETDNIELAGQSPVGESPVTEPEMAPHFINVKDYGATGDGSTDDTAAIQNALDENPGYPIYFPHGTYNVTTIVVPPTGYGTTLFGDSFFSALDNTMGTQIIGTGTGTANTIEVIGTSAGSLLYGVTIRNLEINKGVESTGGSAVFVKWCDSFRIEGCIVGEHHFGVRYTDCTHTQTVNCRLYNYLYPATPVSAASNLLFSSAVGFNGWTHQVHACNMSSDKIGFPFTVGIYGTDALIMSDCYIAGGRVANVYAEPSTGQINGTVQITNCYFDHAVSDLETTTYANVGLYITNNAAGGSYNVTGCVFNGEQYGLLFTGSSALENIRVTGCVFQYMGNTTVQAATSDAIQGGPAKMVTIVGNQFQYLYRGINLSTINSGVINANSFYDLNHDAIWLQGTCNAMAVVGNSFYQVDGEDVNDDASGTQTVASSASA